VHVPANTNDIEEAPLPAIFGHCEKVYDLMRQQAQAVEREGVRIVVWEGFLTQLIGVQLNLPTPYYTSVKNNLVRMECVRQLQRGGGNSPSQWELVKRPTPTLFREKAPKRSQRDLALETMRGQISDLRQQVAKQDEMLRKVIEHVNNHTHEVKPEGIEEPSTHDPETGERLITSTNSGHETVEVAV
jgi:hypothetical protein